MALKVADSQKYLSTANGKPALYGSGGGVAPDLTNPDSINYSGRQVEPGYSSLPTYLYDDGVIIGKGSVGAGNGLLAIGDPDNKTIRVYDAERILESAENPEALLYKIIISDANTSSIGSYVGPFGMNSIVIAQGQLIFSEVRYPSNNSVGRVHVYNLDGTQKFIINSPISVNETRFGNNIAAGEDRIALKGGAGIPRTWLYNKDGTLIKEITLRNSEYGTPYAPECVDFADGLMVVSTARDSTFPGSSNREGFVGIYDLDGNLLREIVSPEPDVTRGEKFGRHCAIGGGVIAVTCPELSNELNSVLGPNGYIGAIYLFNYNGDHINTLVHFNQAGASGSYGFGKVYIDNGRIYATDMRVNANDSSLVRPGGIAVWDLEGGTIGYLRPNPIDNDDFSREADVKHGIAGVLGNASLMSPTGAVSFKTRNLVDPLSLRQKILGKT
jgi:hypothetical protein